MGWEVQLDMSDYCQSIVQKFEDLFQHSLGNIIVPEDTPEMSVTIRKGRVEHFQKPKLERWENPPDLVDILEELQEDNTTISKLSVVTSKTGRIVKRTEITDLTDYKWVAKPGDDRIAQATEGAGRTNGSWRS